MTRFFANFTFPDWIKEVQLLYREWPLTTIAACIFFACLCFSAGTWFPKSTAPPVNSVVDVPQPLAEPFLVDRIESLGVCGHCNGHHFLITGRVLDAAAPPALRPGGVILIGGSILIVDEVSIDDRRIVLRARMIEQPKRKSPDLTVI